MPIKLHKEIIEYGKLKGHGFILLPPTKYKEKCKGMAVFAHGYTSHKGDLLSWASRLCEEGMACMIFDLPGHHLGGALCDPSFEDFTKDAHQLFLSAVAALKHRCGGSETLILGGHSLGALLALKAMGLAELGDYKKTAVAVGFGLVTIDGEHIFKSAFFKSTLNLREQLVTADIKPEEIFPWIKREKEKLDISGARIHLIVGEDDQVIGNDGVDRLVTLLESNGNNVSLDRPVKLAHHVPEQAASFIKKFLKEEKII